MATHSYLVEYADWRKPCITSIWYLDGTSTQLTIRLTLLLRSWDELQGHDKFLPSQPSLLPVRDVPNSLQDLACSDRATKEQVVQCQIMSNNVICSYFYGSEQVGWSRDTCLTRQLWLGEKVKGCLSRSTNTCSTLAHVIDSVQFCSVLTSSDQFSLHCFLQNLLINMRLPSENVSLNTCWLPEDSVVPADKKHQMYQNARHTVHSKYSNILNLGLPAIGHCHWWAEQRGAGRRVATNLRGHFFSTLLRDCAVRENAWPSWWQTVSNGSGKLAANLKDQWSQPEQPGRGSPSA